MEQMMRRLRFLMESPLVPTWIKIRIKGRLVQFLYSNRHNRTAFYLVKVLGSSFYLNADWMDYTDGLLLLEPIYEPGTTRFLHRMLPQGGMFVNAGSNIGYFPLFVASLKRGIDIISIEALSRNYEVQQAAIQKNGFEKTITLHHAAVADENKVGEITTKQLNSGSGSIVGYFGPEKDQPSLAFHTETCDFKTLEVLVSSERHIDVLLMDIQGAEYQALTASPTLLERISYLVVEYTDTPTDTELCTWLLAQGFSLYQITDQGMLTPTTASALKHAQNYVYTKEQVQS